MGVHTSVRRDILIAVALLLLVGSLPAVAGEAAPARTPIRIGIMQIVEHPSLDASRQGFIDALSAAGLQSGRDVVYTIKSAQGDLGTAHTIARQFVADRVDLILAIATPTAQAAAQATRTIPILITAVTDPVAAGLVQRLDRPGTNVTGTSDLTPVAAQLRLLKQIVPRAQRVGVIYNAGETNSQVQMQLARQAASELGLRVVEANASSSGEVFAAAQSLVGRIDAFYVFTDNTVVSALESVIRVAEDRHLALIVGEGDSVRRGGLATVGIDYYRLGQQTGAMAWKVLREGATPATMPIQFQAEAQLILNREAARRMGVTLPEELVAQAAEVVP